MPFSQLSLNEKHPMHYQLGLAMSSLSFWKSLRKMEIFTVSFTLVTSSTTAFLSLPKLNEKNSISMERELNLFPFQMHALVVKFSIIIIAVSTEIACSPIANYTVMHHVWAWIWAHAYSELRLTSTNILFNSHQIYFVLCNASPM